jgi:ABC-type nitrate/sulfonate/bicarbonate transport system substrate-binding protein
MSSRGEAVKRSVPTRALTVLAMSVLLVVGACGSPSGRSDDGSGSVKIMTGSLKSMSASGLLMLAQDAGLFERYGVDVELVSAKSSVVATQALGTGDVDFAAIGTSDAWLAGARQDPIVTPLKLFSGVSTSMIVSPAVAATVAPGASLDERLRALNGRTIATISARSNTTGILRNAMATIGGSARETFMDQPTMVSAFRSGQIDGFMATSPSVDEVVAAGEGVLWVDGPSGEYPGTGDDFFHTTLAGSESYLTDNPEQFRRIAAALIDASEMVRERPDEASGILRARFPELSDDLWRSVWAANGASLGDIRPAERDIAPAVATVVPEEARRSVEESTTDVSRLLATDAVQAADRSRTP